MLVDLTGRASLWFVDRLFNVDAELARIDACLLLFAVATTLTLPKLDIGL